MCRKSSDSSSMSAASDLKLLAKPSTSSTVPNRFKTAAAPSTLPKINWEQRARNSSFASGEALEPTHDSLATLPGLGVGTARFDRAWIASLSTSSADSLFAVRIPSSRSTVASSKAWSIAARTCPLGVLDVTSSSQAATILRTVSTLNPHVPSIAIEYRAVVPTRSTLDDEIPLRKQRQSFLSLQTMSVGCSKLDPVRKSSHHRFEGASARNA